MQTLTLLIAASYLGAPMSTPMAIAKAEAELLRVDGDVVMLKWDAAAMRRRHADRQPFVLEKMPVSATKSVDLELAPFSIAGPETLFALGRKGAPDEPFFFDTSQVQAFRGRVKGQPGSDVFFVFGEHQSTGYIDFGLPDSGRSGSGMGRGRLLLSSRDGEGHPLAAGHTSIFPSGSGVGYMPPVPYCGVEATGPHAAVRPNQGGGRPLSGFGPAVGIRHVELAVDTDFEYFLLFGDRDAAVEYLVQIYTEVAHIYLRDTGAEFELVFARLWDDPDNPFDPITGGAGVTFDVAQLFSGRRDAFAGGVAVAGLCGGGVASMVWYVQGAFPDPTMPSPYHYDIFVAAHELGHNAGAPHTHDAGIDDCANPSATPQRGTIMSYCQQTYNGLNANQDLYFHRQLAVGMTNVFQSVSCTTDDCNLNHTDDALDIAAHDSMDVNENGIPDECEDCNANGVLDNQDIASGASNDVNVNAVPDECEPDCNGNAIPDRWDILMETSVDAYGNAIPDECETDCNGNGVSDYTEIQAEMPLDVDRNAILDSCQDCDGDGTTDHAALNGAHYLWIVSGEPGQPLREFFPTTGVFTRASVEPIVGLGRDVAITPDGRILASSVSPARIQVYDRSAALLGDFIAPAILAGHEPVAMLVTPDGRLLVSINDTNSILAFDAQSGTAMGAFVAPGSGGLSGPYGMTIGPNGNLFVTSGTNEVIEYDGQSGALVGTFVSAAANGGLVQPRDLVFKRDGHLLVTSFGTDQVLEYDGATGAPMGSWVVLGFAVSGMTPQKPWGIEIGPNGNVFVSRAVSFEGHDESGQHSDAHSGGKALHLSNAQIFEYDVCNGNFARVHVGGSDVGLVRPTGFMFMPGWAVDCNVNQLPDSCDVASGASADANGNQIPDECEIDCNGNGRLDRLDIIPFGPSLDCNNNLLPDGCDIAAGTSTDCNANGVPDECEPDCNGIAPIDSCGFDAGSMADCDGNGLPDSCEIFLATAEDCNANCTPDPCEANFDGDALIDDCDADIDNDQVPNSLDVCDFTPLGLPVASDGRPLADTNGNCRIDLTDYGRLVLCLIAGGPGVAAQPSCLAVFGDGDGDIDLHDAAALLNHFDP